MAETMISDIDRRVEHIDAQVGLGAAKEVVAQEQAQALLSSFSMLTHVELDVVTAVSKHLSSKSIWTRTQLAAFSACLRAAAGGGSAESARATAHANQRILRTFSGAG